MRWKHALLAAAIALMPVAGHAAGFYINEQSAKGLGRAFAGAAAVADDAASLWYNPAHAVSLPRSSTLTLSGVFSDATIEDRGSTFAGVPVVGAPGDDPLENGYIPASAAVLPLSPEFALGVSVNAPFGLVVSYPENFFGRFDSTRTELVTINAQGGFAWRIHPRLDIGAGANVQYAEAVLESAIPTGAAVDGRVVVEGNDYAVGWNAGLVWRPIERLSVGASYRSAIQFDLDGRQTVTVPTGNPAQPFASALTSGAAELETPAIVFTGAAYEINQDWTVMSQVSWFQWSNFQEIRVRTPAGDTVREQNYEDAFQYSLGVERRFNDEWTGRAGVMYEESPTQDAFRSTRVPDSDRYWVSAGASWTPTRVATFDASLAYVRLDTADITRTDTFPGGAQFDLRSEIEGDAVVGALGATFRF